MFGIHTTTPKRFRMFLGYGWVCHRLAPGRGRRQVASVRSMMQQGAGACRGCSWRRREAERGLRVLTSRDGASGRRHVVGCLQGGASQGQGSCGQSGAGGGVDQVCVRCVCIDAVWMQVLAPVCLSDQISMYVSSAQPLGSLGRTKVFSISERGGGVGWGGAVHMQVDARCSVWSVKLS